MGPNTHLSVLILGEFSVFGQIGVGKYRNKPVLCDYKYSFSFETVKKEDYLIKKSNRKFVSGYNLI